ncbi:hypothetical protein ANCCAN_25397 [Ancylostoma caninum]|uniref:Uncharacterized protein n=1 Tax=Ancylostoma caninum TaxID=29170 RepID=A0A368FDI6_ANCCA|nr:hypothetical protein ANCCAN_25397 [Ancylostoma caninum]
MSEELRPFYTLSSDLISLLTVLASGCRLPIYIACNARIRCEVLDALNNCVLFRTEKNEKVGSPKNVRGRATTVRYCDTGCGFMVYEVGCGFMMYEPINKKGETRVRSIGTGLDRIVLSVAMGSMGAMGNRTAEQVESQTTV